MRDALGVIRRYSLAQLPHGHPIDSERGARQELPIAIWEVHSRVPPDRPTTDVAAIDADYRMLMTANRLGDREPMSFKQPMPLKFEPTPLVGDAQIKMSSTERNRVMQWRALHILDHEWNPTLDEALTSLGNQVYMRFRVIHKFQGGMFLARRRCPHEIESIQRKPSRVSLDELIRVMGLRVLIDPDNFEAGANKTFTCSAGPAV